MFHLLMLLSVSTLKLEATMKKMLLLSLALVCFAGLALAGNNPGVSTYLTWSATSIVTDQVWRKPLPVIRRRR